MVLFNCCLSAHKPAEIGLMMVELFVVFTKTFPGARHLYYKSEIYLGEILTKAILFSRTMIQVYSIKDWKNVMRSSALM